MRATLHLVNREFEALADDFVTLGMLPKAEVGAALLLCAAGMALAVVWWLGLTLMLLGLGSTGWVWGVRAGLCVCKGSEFA